MSGMSRRRSGCLDDWSALLGAVRGRVRVFHQGTWGGLLQRRGKSKVPELSACNFSPTCNFGTENVSLGFGGFPRSRPLRSDDDNQQQTKAKLHTAATTPWSRQNWAPLPRYPYPTPAVQPSPFFLLAPLNSRRPTTLVVLNEENMHKNHGILCTLQSSVGPPTLSHIRQSVWSYLPFAAHPPPLPLISMRARERASADDGRPRHQT